MQVHIRILDEDSENGMGEYTFPSSDEGQKALKLLKQHLEGRDLRYETPEHDWMAIRVFDYDTVQVVTRFLENWAKIGN